jgi:uncharacterized RDD family membrane protein YckC
MSDNRPMTSASALPEDPTDVVGRRAAAFLIDVVLLTVLGLVVFAALRYRSYSGVPASACTVLRKGANGSMCLQVGGHVFLWHAGAAKTALLVTAFFAFLNNVVLQSIAGSTVGKMCFRLCVVDENGAKTHPLRMFGRWVFLLVDIGFFLVGCFMTLGTHPHRRIGDYVFGTYVVPMRSVGRPVVAGAASAREAAVGAGVPANWTAPPVPAPAARPAPAAAAAATPQLKTPPGTAPTAPGEWGAVARPAPVVRSPQWATPPPADPDAAPPVIEAGASPKWAAPPLADPEASDDDDIAEDEVVAEDEETVGEEETVGDEEPADAKAEAEKAEAKDESEAEVDAEEPVVVADEETEPETADETNPDVAEWSPVTKPRKRRGAKTGASKAADGSWWDAALSSGDSEAEVEADEK